MEGDEKTVDKSVIYGILAACVLGIIIIGALVVSSDMSEGFSELYFEDHTELPIIVEVGEETNLAFSVASHEKDLTDYCYNVTFDDRLLEQGQFALQPGENTTINVTLVPYNSSLIPFDIPKIAVSYLELAGECQVLLPISDGSSGATVTIPHTVAAKSSWNFSEVRRIGSRDHLIDGDDSGSISSLGYVIHKEKYQIIDKKPVPVLKYVLNETEYRYKFNKVSIEVSSQQRISGEDGAGVSNKNKHDYEIHFWLIVEEDLDKLFGL